VKVHVDVRTGARGGEMFTPDAYARRPAQQRSPFETYTDVRSILAAPRRLHRDAADADVVARRVRLAPSCAADVLDALPADVAALEFDAPFTAMGGATVPGWRTTGRIHMGGFAGRSTKVDVECNGWSTDSIELRVRPVTRRVARWGRRRQRHYFELAHRSIDELVRCMTGLVHSTSRETVLDLVRCPPMEVAVTEAARS
jgi:hypothetical protein